MISTKAAAICAYVSGILLLIAGTTGSIGIVGTIIQYALDNLSGVSADFLSLVLHMLNIVADLGGISVIIGGTLILKQRKWIGKFVIGLGAGMGLFGFMLTIVSALLHGWTGAITFLFMMTQSIGWIGVIFAIVATVIAR
ncbi:MAG: hypothetical protein NWF03_05825 [Candidatus Bathyarchaeota archaeon]|nr:hypothetical protein [Candidatus Bathyarchaeota archaeon]